jgi:quercetin dioxygenase-like cupin family protein
MSRAAAVPTVQIVNDRMRVTEWRFAPGAATGFHRHDYDYCVVPLYTGRLGIEAKDKAMTEAQLKTGVSYYRNAGVEHDVINVNPFEFAFIEIELKEKAKG